MRGLESDHGVYNPPPPFVFRLSRWQGDRPPEGSGGAGAPPRGAAADEAPAQGRESQDRGGGGGGGRRVRPQVLAMKNKKFE